jgi:hypothetical protein
MYWIGFFLVSALFVLGPDAFFIFLWKATKVLALIGGLLVGLTITHAFASTGWGYPTRYPGIYASCGPRGDARQCYTKESTWL